MKATADHCLTQFSSRDTGSSHNQIEFQQETMKEMRMHLEEAVEVVKSHADQLITVLGKTQVNNSAVWIIILIMMYCINRTHCLRKDHTKM